MNNLDKLTILIVTFLTDKQILLNCLNSIDRNVKILIVENSNSFKDKKFFLKKFSNLKIVTTGENLGYGKGNNFGLRYINTEYAFILNPDSILDRLFFNKIDKYLSRKDFAIIGCSSLDNSPYIPGGFFDNEKNLYFKNNFKNESKKNLMKVDWVTGNSLILNLKKFNNQFFDENYFLYYEEFDMCFRLMKKSQKVFLSKNLKVRHIGFKSSKLNFYDFKSEADKLRNWHWMWSVFYFHKKNYGYLSALSKTIFKFLKSLFKTIIYTLIFNKENRDKYFYRMYGLFSSMIGKKSFYRGKYFN